MQSIPEKQSIILLQAQQDLITLNTYLAKAKKRSKPKINKETNRW